MNHQLDLSTVLWVVGALLTIAMALTGTIWALLLKNIDHVRNSIKEAADTVSKEREHCDKLINELNEKLEAERDSRVARHDASIERVFSEIDKVKDKVADLEVTVAGFGSIYATRAEITKGR